MFKNLKKKKNNKGFTLVELLVVIAIIGILAVVAIPSLFGNINKSKAAKIEADFSTIRTAAMAEYADGKTLDQIGDYVLTGAGTVLPGIEGLAPKSPVTYTIVKIKSGTPEATTGVKLTVETGNAEIASKVNTDLGGTAISYTPNSTSIDLLLVGKK